MTVVSDLFLLQELDLALDRATARLGEIEESLKETEELIAARQLRTEKENAVELLKDRQKELEWQVEEVRSKAGEVESKLYGGTVRNPKELSDLDADLRALRAQTGKREDTLLALLVEIEDAEAEMRAAEREYAALNNEFASQSARLTEEKAALEPEAEALKGKRDERAATSDRAALGLYELLRSRKGGVAIARVEQGMCQGCRITLPAAILTRAKISGAPVQCVSCERILFVN